MFAWIFVTEECLKNHTGGIAVIDEFYVNLMLGENDNLAYTIFELIEVKQFYIMDYANFSLTNVCDLFNSIINFNIYL